MSNDTQSARLLIAHDTVYLTEGWIQPLLPTLRELSADEAAWKPTPDSKSVWEIAAHLANYTEDLATDLRGVDIGKYEDWPVVSDTSEEAWKALVSRLEASVLDLKSSLEGLSDEALATPPDGMKTPRWRRITDILIHDAYHAGQVYQLVGLRQAMREPVAP